MSLHSADASWLADLDVIGSIIYLLDLWLGFQLGVVARWEGRAVVVQSERELHPSRKSACWRVPAGQRGGTGLLEGACCCVLGAEVGGQRHMPARAPSCPSCPPCRCAAADWRVSARFYIQRGTFWTDFVACLPIIVEIAVAASGSNQSALRLISVLRLLRLIRCA